MMHDHETAEYGSTNLDFFISSKGMKKEKEIRNHYRWR